ncbi:MAG: hypothetical protein ACFFCS_10705 [Candidatus Hodarchaeota archaeon]
MSCRRKRFKNQRARIVHISDGDIYEGDSVEEAKQIFYKMKKESRKAGGSKDRHTATLIIDDEFVDVF